MSIEYTTNGPHQPLFAQQDIDHPFSSLPADSIQQGHAHNQGHLPLNGHAPDALDIPDHPPYDIFSSSSSGSLASSRYRANASSSSSLGHNYALGVDPLYPSSTFGNDLPPFHSSNSSFPHDLMSGGLPSSYSSGKPSPLTPSDVGPLSHPSGFPFSNGQSKDYSPHQPYDIDRRLSGVSPSSYSPDFDGEFGGIGVNSNMGLGGFHPSNGLQFQDRLGRLPGDHRFQGSVVPPQSIPSHLGQNHNGDLIRGVAPGATHYRGGDALFPQDDVPQFMTPSPQVDYPLRMSVDETMSRLRLQGAGDLQTFIRYVRHG